MRYIPAAGLIEGMIIGRSLFDRNHKLLLKAGSEVKPVYIERIKQLGYQGVYIDDEISKDIEVKDIINDEIRMKTIQIVKDICIHATLDDLTNKKDRTSIEDRIKKTRNLISDIVEQIIENKDAMVNLIDLKFFDDYTFFHSVNVAVLSVVVGVGMGLSKECLYNLAMAAVLHDIGKIFIDLKILNKNGRLSSEEYELIKRHSEFGYKYLKETYQIPASAYVGVLHHHEKYDGTGYPDNIAKDKIPLIGRIIGIADTYDALVSERPYRKALLPSEAMEYIMANGGIMFDLEITKIFTKKIAPFPEGTYAKLSNGYVGIVAQNFEEACMRPVVKVILNEKGEKIDPIYCNLKDDKSLRSVTITGINCI